VTDLQRMEAERQVISEVVHALNENGKPDELLAASTSAEKGLYAGIVLSRFTIPRRIRFRFRFLRIKWTLRSPAES